MSERRLLSRNQVLVGAGVFLAIWLTAVFVMVGGEDKVVLRAFEELNEKSLYSLESKNSVSKGILGDFYHCLVDYRNIYRMKPGEGEISHAKLVVSEHYFFDFSIVGNEVFRFDVVFVEEGLKEYESKVFKTSKRSDSYAVNCELELLGTR